jgi:hypothetical protein
VWFEKWWGAKAPAARCGAIASTTRLCAEIAAHTFMEDSVPSVYGHNQGVA